MTKVEHALAVLVDELPALLSTHGVAADACVGATRIACLSLAEVGIKASPLATRVQALSPRYVRALRDGEDMRSADRATIKRLRSEGAHLVDIGHPQNEGNVRPDGRRGFNGHLVALVERRYVADLTIHQASRPAKGMVYDPHYFRVTPEFMAGDPLFFGSGDAVAVYARIDNNTYLVAPDWTGVRRDSRLVNLCVRALRKALS